MISEWNYRIGHPRGWKPQVIAFYVLLAIWLTGVAAVFGMFLDPTITRTSVTHTGVNPATLSASAVARAWGQPSQEIPGATVNPNLAGTTCYLWQSKHALLCF